MVSLVRSPFAGISVLTFDCYGTLIDWETGLSRALAAVLSEHGRDAQPEGLLERYAFEESRLESGQYVPYRVVLGHALAAVCSAYGFEPGAEEQAAFADSVADWPAFDDSPSSLARLATRYRLGVITNCDDDLFAASRRRLGVDFDWVVTAQQARRYKPDERPFEIAFERIGVPRHQILHAAQSLYHDHVPARRLGLRTAWINRRRGRTGYGATPPASAEADLEVADMASFAELAMAAGQPAA